jgi:mannose-6-phosphate isomerase-like protein (cupin superfamily)
MTIDDKGPNPSIFDLETETTTNDNYRTVAWSGKYLQVTLMSIPVGESVGLEAHPDTDQFLRLDAGKGRVVMGPSKDNLTIEHEVGDGWAIMVPAGTWHDVINIGDEPMRLYAIYAPVHHAAGKVQPTAADAERDEEAGTDEPPNWSVQPESVDPDQHAG